MRICVEQGVGGVRDQTTEMGVPILYFIGILDHAAQGPCPAMRDPKMERGWSMNIWP